MLSGLGFLFSAAVIFYFICCAYGNYRQELIQTEQKQLLTMAETVGQSLVNFVEQELNTIDLYFSALETDISVPDDHGKVIEQAASAFLEQKSTLYDAVACYDCDGHLLFQEGSMDFGYQWAGQTKQASICGKRLSMNGWYEMFLSKKVTFQDSSYTFIYAMNLNELYSKIVAPVKIGKGGYSIVKDSNLSIIMHHASNQIGMDAIYDRTVLYPQLDLSDLAGWIELQRTQPSGYSVIQSYVWDDPELASEKRIVAYTTIHLPGETWIVNSTLPFQELNGPLMQMIERLAGMGTLFLSILVIFSIIMTRSMMRAENQKKEINYLKEINDGMVLLRQKEEEIQHYQRVQSIGLMSSHIAHEFNNYLTPVMVYGEILEGDDTLSSENQALVKGILNSANQAASLSRKLLDFSRQDSSVALVNVNLTADIKEAADVIRQLAPGSVTVITDIPEQQYYVRGQKGMAEHILMNLCNNAFHAMEGKKGTLTIRLSLTSPPAEGVLPAGSPMQSDRSLPPGSLAQSDSDMVLLSVSDTGCGISQEAMDKIFEPFYTTKRSGKGTGLGLSVIRNIMTAVGGQIQIHSEPGLGTAFSLYFLRVDQNSDSCRGTSPKNIRKLIIVDDDTDMLRSVTAMLKADHSTQDIIVECHDHPAAVLSKLEKGNLDCDAVLTDYSMPSMNGLELCQIIRKQKPDIRLFLMSGVNDSQFDWYQKNQFLDAFILKSDLSKRLIPCLFSQDAGKEIQE